MNLEQRVTQLEKEMADLKRQLGERPEEILDIKKACKEMTSEIVKISQSISAIATLVNFDPVILISKIIEEKKKQHDQ